MGNAAHRREGRRDAYAGGVIRTHYPRQTAIANSTPPIRDNYRADRGTGRAAELHEGVVAEDGSAGGSGSSLPPLLFAWRIPWRVPCLIY